MSMENEAIIKRFMEADRKLREAEEATPTHARTAKPIGQLSVEEAKAESRRLAASNPALVAARAKGKAQKQQAQTAAEFRAAQVRAHALANEAIAAYEADDNWTQVEDEDGYYMEDRNLAWEDTVAKLLDLGPAAETAVRKLVDEGYEASLIEVAQMVQQRDALQAQAELLTEGKALIEQANETGKKVQARIQSLIAANPWVNPDAHLAEARRLEAQLTSGGATGPDRALIGKAAEEAREQAHLAAMRRDDFITRFQALAETLPGGAFVDFPLAEEALVSSMRVTAAFVNAEHDAEVATRSLRARADQEGIGADSRDASGRLVLMPPDGTGDALYVDDNAAAGLLAQGFRKIRDDVPVQMPDEIAFYPQPTDEELVDELAAEINANDATADDRALQAAIDWAKQAPTMEGQAAEAEAKAKADHAAMVRDANQLTS